MILKITSHIEADSYLQKLIALVSQGDRLIHQVSAALIVKVTGALLAVIVQILMARQLGVADFGTYIYALSWIMVLSIFANMGIHLPVIRFVADYTIHQQYGLLRGLIRRAFQYVLASSLTISSVFIGCIVLLSDRIEVNFYKLLILSAVLLPVLSFSQLAKSFMFALKKPALGMLPDLVIRHVLTVLVLLVFIYFGARLSAFNAITVVIFTGLIGMLITVAILQWARPPESKQHFAKFSSSQWIKTGLPFLWVAAAELLMSRTDILVLGILRPAADVGIYASASLLAASLSMVTTSVESVTASRFAEYFARNDRKSAQRLLINMTRWLTTAILPIALVLIFTGDRVLLLFGKEFSDGATVLSILVITQLIFVSVGSVGQLLGLSGNQTDFAVGMTLSGVLNVGLSVILIPVYGSVGAALARFITIVCMLTGFSFLVWKRLGLMPTIVAPLLMRMTKQSIH